jgi:hypothetical protein
MTLVHHSESILRGPLTVHIKNTPLLPIAHMCASPHPWIVGRRGANSAEKRQQRVPNDVLWCCMWARDRNVVGLPAVAARLRQYSKSHCHPRTSPLSLAHLNLLARRAPLLPVTTYLHLLQCFRLAEVWHGVFLWAGLRAYLGYLVVRQS